MELKFGKKIINKNSKFIIAEIGNNHNGSYQNAVKMIDKAVKIKIYSQERIKVNLVYLSHKMKT